MTDYTFVRGFRTAACYYAEDVFGTFNVGNSASGKYRKVGGKVKNINWTVRQGIMKTSNIGEGRNYKQLLFGSYDASASVTWEVSDFSFLKHAVGDCAVWGGTGTSASNPFMLLEAEISGTDAPAELHGTDTTAYAKVRVRPFSMLLYDDENAVGSATFNESHDKLHGCSISDFSLSAALNAPLMCSTNIVVREISHRRMLADTDIPDWTSEVVTRERGFGSNGDSIGFSMSPKQSQARADSAPLMFYQGKVYFGEDEPTPGTFVKKRLAQVTSFTFNYNNGFNVYREIGSRFINQPIVGMRNMTLSMNLVFRLPQHSTNGDAGLLAEGKPGADSTTILEIIKNYMGYASTANWANTTELYPASSTGSGAPTTVEPPVRNQVTLDFTEGTTRGSTLNVYNVAPEGFGKPVVLENGMVEVPITFSVKGYPYKKAGDGSYGGYVGEGTNLASYKPILSWWIA